MIHVEHLTKRFVGRAAVDDISFHVGEGEIVGFLGPNGAGKTTTIRMLTGFLPATSGSARIAGHDIFTDSLAARRRIGYMPENVPLYPDMRVKEYLRYRAALKGLSKKEIGPNVAEVLDKCGLVDVRKKMIGKLSKGFRQRVGLADTLVHKPELLILDEPTNGLDPIQIRQIRELINELAKNHTILLSTHILPEVEVTCQRVIIIDQGKIKASDTPKNLASRLRSAGGIDVEIRTQQNAGQVVQLIKSIPNVKRVTQEALDDGWLRLTVRTMTGSEVRPEIHQVASANQWQLRELSLRIATLEDVFVELTHH